MPYVRRNDEGNISGIFMQKSDEANEHLEGNDPEILEFLSTDKDAVLGEEEPDALQDLHHLRLSDLGMIRVVEDLIELLVEKDVISMAELPKNATVRLKHRQKLRNKLQPYAHALSGDKDTNVMNPRTWLEED